LNIFEYFNFRIFQFSNVSIFNFQFALSTAEYHQRSAPFGLHHLQCSDSATLGCESCEELWTPQSTHISLSLRGVEILSNGSGSHHELRKLQTRMELMINATRKCGGVYLYANQRGCDGGRTYYDGCAMIVVNGRIVAQARQFDVREVEVVCATVDLEDVRSYRASNPAFGIQAARSASEEGGTSAWALSLEGVTLTNDCQKWSPEVERQRPKVMTEGGLELRVPTPEEECCLGPACWMWDFLRRSGAAGFFLPLSGEFERRLYQNQVSSLLCWKHVGMHSNGNDDIFNNNYSR